MHIVKNGAHSWTAVGFVADLILIKSRLIMWVNFDDLDTRGQCSLWCGSDLDAVGASSPPQLQTSTALVAGIAAAGLATRLWAGLDRRAGIGVGEFRPKLGLTKGY